MTLGTGPQGRSRVPTVARFAWAGGLVFVSIAALADDRRWETVQLAWRGDPRAVADGPLGSEVPQTRRQSRRAQRRSMRRGQPPPEVARSSLSPGDSLAAGPTARAASAGAGLTPTPGNGCLVHHDQPYAVATAPHPRRRLDLHLPAACSGGRLPLVIWIPGTDWRTGTKADCPITWLVSRGYAVASVGYRTTDEAKFPAQLDDCRAAVESLVAAAEIWGIDTSRVCVAGGAAGGHLAALVGLDAPTRRGGGGGAAASAAPQAPIAAVCTFGAPTLLTTLGPDHDRAGSAASRLVGGPLPEFREAAHHASPASHVTADDPPALIVHGGRDPLVPVAQAVAFDRLLRAAGVEAKLVLLDDATTVVPAKNTAAGTALVEFLDRVLGPGERPDGE